MGGCPTSPRKNGRKSYSRPAALTEGMVPDDLVAAPHEWPSVVHPRAGRTSRRAGLQYAERSATPSDLRVRPAEEGLWHHFGT